MPYYTSTACNNDWCDECLVVWCMCACHDDDEDEAYYDH